LAGNPTTLGLPTPRRKRNPARHKQVALIRKIKTTFNSTKTIELWREEKILRKKLLLGGT